MRLDQGGYQSLNTPEAWVVNGVAIEADPDTIKLAAEKKATLSFLIIF
jgi:hypothetical protein